MIKIYYDSTKKQEQTLSNEKDFFTMNLGTLSFMLAMIFLSGHSYAQVQKAEVKLVCDDYLECSVKFDLKKIPRPAVEAFFKLNIIGQESAPICAGAAPTSLPTAEGCNHELKLIREAETLLAAIPKDPATKVFRDYFSSFLSGNLAINLVQDAMNKGQSKSEQIKSIEALYAKYGPGGACAEVKTNLINSPHADLMTESHDLFLCLSKNIEKRAGGYPKSSFDQLLKHYGITKIITDTDDRD